MFYRSKPLGRLFRMKFWTEHRKFEGKTLASWAKPGTSSVKSVYSVLPVEAGLFPENTGVAKKETTCFEDCGWDCLNTNEPAARSTFACILILSKLECLKEIVFVIVMWPRIAINKS